MDPIVLVSAKDLTYLLSWLAWEKDQGGLHTLRVAIDDGGVKFKVNSGTWSPPLGKVER